MMQWVFDTSVLSINIIDTFGVGPPVFRLDSTSVWLSMKCMLSPLPAQNNVYYLCHL